MKVHYLLYQSICAWSPSLRLPACQLWMLYKYFYAAMYHVRIDVEIKQIKFVLSSASCVSLTERKLLLFLALACQLAYQTQQMRDGNNTFHTSVFEFISCASFYGWCAAKSVGFVALNCCWLCYVLHNGWIQSPYQSWQELLCTRRKAKGILILFIRDLDKSYPKLHFEVCTQGRNKPCRN